ncbi:hydrogenase 3 maturation protease [Anaerolineae bacterium]|nr:hydrogenase 3 maturation protease [Anaerolineae bacterium]
MLDELRDRVIGKKLAILGVGNPLRGDDGIGPALIERLQGKTSAILINAGDVPENYLGVVQAAQPAVVLIVDAVELGAKPGDAALIEVEQLGGVIATTHNTSLAPFAQMIRAETGADVFVVAIQPATGSLGAPMSAEVKATLEYLDKWFQALRID